MLIKNVQHRVNYATTLLRFLWFGLSALAACGAYAASPEVIDPPAEQLATALASYAQSANAGQLAPYRHEIRRDLFMEAVHEALIKPDWKEADLFEDLSKVPGVDFLCLPNWRQAKESVHFANIATDGKVLGSTAQSSASDIPGLLKAIGTDYTIHPDNKSSPGPYAEWLKGSPDATGKLESPGGKRCSDAVSAADPYRTRDLTDRNAAAVAATLALIDTVWAVLKPVMVGTLQNIDIERRAAAIKDFFATQENVSRLQNDLAASELFLDGEFRVAQERTAGRAVVNASVLFDVKASHWQKAIAGAGSPQCREGLSKLASKATDPPGITCLDAVFEATQKPLEAALKAADDFDAALAQSLPSGDKKLSTQIDTLRKIALGQSPPEDQVKGLWAAALRYVALYQTVNTAVSPENQKKIVDAWTALAKALGTK